MNKNADVGTAGADRDVLTRLADVIQSWPDKPTVPRDFLVPVEAEVVTMAFAEIEDLRRQLAAAHGAGAKIAQESWHRFAFSDKKPTTEELNDIVKQALGSVRTIAYANAYKVPGDRAHLSALGWGKVMLCGAMWDTMWQARDEAVDGDALIGTVALMLIKPKE